MQPRTDLAIEKIENLTENKQKKIKEEINITEVEINSYEKQELFGKKQGKYITVEFENVEINKKEIEMKIEKALISLLPQKREKILVAGLGNRDIISDSIGPFTAEKIIATRHIKDEFEKEKYFEKIKSVAVSIPDVVSKTGIESAENIKAITKIINADIVIVIDALASKSIDRLFKTVQLCNTGISPGSGVKNKRKEISEKTIGIPVIAIGVPTVVDAMSLAFELSGKEPDFKTDLIVTPKDADILCYRISEILANAINNSLQL